MTPARYMIRLDDACPSMAHAKWARFEDVFARFGVKPIVAVVPDNQDPNLQRDAVDPTFWDTVRAWADKGWRIALHGHTHVYTTREKGLVPLNARSEFAGVPAEEQRRKIATGYSLLQEKGLAPKIWVAPAHSFDLHTLEALRQETDIRIISDGLATAPYTEHGFTWLPAQNWRVKKKSTGLWTSCYHPNDTPEKELKILESFLQDNAAALVDDLDLLVKNAQNHPRSMADKAYFSRFLLAQHMENLLYPLYRRIRDTLS